VQLTAQVAPLLSPLYLPPIVAAPLVNIHLMERVIRVHRQSIVVLLAPMQATAQHARLPLLLFLPLIAAALLLNICLQTSAICALLLFLIVMPAAVPLNVQLVPLLLF